MKKEVLDNVYYNVQNMLDRIDPEIGDEFRKYQRKPLVRLRKWWYWVYYWFRSHKKKEKDD